MLASTAKPSCPKAKAPQPCYHSHARKATFGNCREETPCFVTEIYNLGDNHEGMLCSISQSACFGNGHTEISGKRARLAKNAINHERGGERMPDRAEACINDGRARSAAKSGKHKTASPQDMTQTKATGENAYICGV